MEELKLSEEKIRKELVTEMIIDELYRAFEKTSKGKVTIDIYTISKSNLLYLLEKYDKDRFNAYTEMLLKGNNEDE